MCSYSAVIGSYYYLNKICHLSNDIQERRKNKTNIMITTFESKDKTRRNLTQEEKVRSRRVSISCSTYDTTSTQIWSMRMTQQSN